MAVAVPVGFGVSVLVGIGATVLVDDIVAVLVSGSIAVGGADVETSPQPVKTVNSVKTKNTDPMDFFITVSPFDIEPNVLFSPRAAPILTRFTA
ncbi:MAG: hypothetical protein A2Z16_12805 [Chloroflexi bacterium RBG_16_54_18]|nr:MAG: hypothetical protein A2Z16_12805 [Chloroflexi bacterium RBG_16_54_18]